jgi:magnesium-protoporphyrin O-methyltransferase
MTCCAHCRATDEHFGLDAARRDLERYHRRGPDATTRRMLEAIGRTPLRGGTLLDIGAGIGVIHHELLGVAIARATHVEAASAYVRVAREEDARRGAEESVDYLFGDAVELSDDLPAADLVTLDRVICCYPDWESLVRVSASKVGRLYAFSLPHDRWYVRTAVAISNLVRRLRGDDLRVFVHPVGEIDGMLVARGFRRIARRRTFVWHIALYRSAEPAL